MNRYDVSTFIFVALLLAFLFLLLPALPVALVALR
jgi:hypothetical protein